MLIIPFCWLLVPIVTSLLSFPSLFPRWYTVYFMIFLGFSILCSIIPTFNPVLPPINLAELQEFTHLKIAAIIRPFGDDSLDCFHIVSIIPVTSLVVRSLRFIQRMPVYTIRTLSRTLSYLHPFVGNPRPPRRPVYATSHSICVVHPPGLWLRPQHHRAPKTFAATRAAGRLLGSWMPWGTLW